MKRLLAVVALSALVAVPALAEDPAPTGVAEAEKLIVHMETLAGVVRDSSGDCDKLAGTLTTFVDEHGASIAELTDRIDAMPEATQADLKARFEDRSQVAGETMLEGLLTCSGHDGVMKAFERLERDPAPAASASATPVDPGDVEKLVVHMETMASLMSTHQSDCPAMATALDGFAEANKPEIAELSQRLSSMPIEQQEALEAEYKDRMEGAITKVMQGVMACADDPAVEAAMKKLDF